jgi:hypothetical protein
MKNTMFFSLSSILQLLCVTLLLEKYHTAVLNCTHYDPKTCHFDSLKLSLPEIGDLYSNNNNSPDDGGERKGMFNMIDYERKIMMSFSPKAACSKSVMIFLSGMGHFYGVDYTDAHVFRNKQYEKHCGIGSPCLMHDNSWFKFKVVRNPFDRAVSSYLHMMREKWPCPYDLVKKKEGRDNVSFHMLIDFLLSKANGLWNFDCYGHVEKQISPLEKFYWQRNEPSPFNFIIKSENMKSDWIELNRLKNTSYRNTDNKHRNGHLALRSNKSILNVGDTPYGKLLIPESFRLFYNDVIKAKVERLFNDDLVIYNYTYPF